MVLNNRLLKLAFWFAVFIVVMLSASMGFMTEHPCVGPGMVEISWQEKAFCEFVSSLNAPALKLLANTWYAIVIGYAFVAWRMNKTALKTFVLAIISLPLAGLLFEIIPALSSGKFGASGIKALIAGLLGLFIGYTFANTHKTTTWRKALWLIISLILVTLSFGAASMVTALKPVIYLYPAKTEKVAVELDYKGELRTTYPTYNPAIKGWSVTAHPDGTLVNDADGKQYSYLFWEGNNYDFPINLHEGFVVKGSDTAVFLQNTLAALGLTPREYNEFIVFWLPKMQDNPYNFIHFAGTEYSDIAPLTITPKPDSMLRVFMLFKPLEEPVSVTKQVLPSFQRHGFSVVEWGGAEIAH